MFQKKMKFTERFKRRHPLRFHMSMILLATISAGFVATRGLLFLNLENVMLRYPLTVIFAYLVFFLSVKVWLNFIAPVATARRATETGPVDAGDFLPDLPISFSGGDGALRGGGGEFSGGGASGNWDAAVADGGGLFTSANESGPGIGEAVGGAAGDAVSSAVEEAGGIALVVIAVLAAALAVVVGTGAYLVYEAPFILSEAAFEFVLAAGLVRRAKEINSADWMGSVFKTTWIPFAITLALATLAGYLMHRYFPEANRLAELLTLL